MKKLTGARVPVADLDRHSYICDLLFFEGPLVSLYKSHHTNWIHLWADCSNEGDDRWLAFPVDRSNLVKYLNKQVTMRALIAAAKQIIAIDSRAVTKLGQSRPTVHRSAKVVGVDQLVEYWPDPDSYFDESLTNDITLAEELAPKLFSVPIDGQWFLPDLAKFSNSYTRLYAFFYCTAPRFVTNLQSKIARYMQSPWQGGYSRINLFDAMNRQIPSVHEMRVARYDYASPGEIEIEALDSVGESIKRTVLAYVSKKDEVDRCLRKLDATLGTAKVRKIDLSRSSEEELARTVIAVLLNSMNQAIHDLASLLGLHDQISLLRQSSPNSVVTAKAVLAFGKQVKIIAEYQSAGMLDLNRVAAKQH